MSYVHLLAGFASTGDDVLPGNYGLHDNELALRWAFDNVAAFGGNPHDMTAWGMSSGGIGVGLLTVAPHTRNYFKRSIQNSGSIYTAFALGESVVDYTLEIAKALGCPSTRSEDVKQCLKSRTVRQIMDAQARCGFGDHISALKWKPRVDGRFFPKDIPELLKESPPLPTLTGYTTEEMHGLCECGFLLQHDVTVFEGKIVFEDVQNSSPRLWSKQSL